MKRVLAQEKILWLDLETTGLNPKKNDIWQVGMMIEVDGQVMDEADLKMAPRTPSSIDKKALEMSGHDKATMMSFSDPRAVMATFKEILAKYVDRFDSDDKFVLAGFNIATFDDPFLREAFRKDGDKFYGSWFFNAVLDVRAFVPFLLLRGYRFPDLKLETICEGLGIEIQAHDALSDIRATRTLWQFLRGFVSYGG